MRSAAEQLAGVAGTTVTSARNLLETSKRVEELPATAAAIAPDAEEKLLREAERKSLGEVREECLRARATVDRDAAHARIHRDRYFREYLDAEGGWNCSGRGTPEDGARFRAQHGPLVDQHFKRARTEGRKEPYAAYAFDAFLQLAERGEDHTAVSSKQTPARFLGLIRVDHAALVRASVEGDETCEINGLGPIPADVARNLLGDAILELVITKGIDVANVTHLGRSATVAQQIALWWTSPTCDVLGCTRTQRLQIDHRHPNYRSPP